MHMGKKGAFLSLAVVVLWAATPALACLTPVAHHSCCQGMAMQNCGSAVMMHCGDCCSVQPGNAPLPPGSAIDHVVGSVTAAAPAVMAVLPAAGDAALLASETPLPPGSPGVGSILRI